MLKSLQRKDDDETQKRFIKINAAAVIGEANNSELYPYLSVLLNDESLDVVQAAVTSIGQIRVNVFVPILIAHLNTKQVRKYARESLAKYGEDIIDTLAEHLENTGEDIKKRLAVPRVLALISSQKSVNLLSKNLGQRYLLLRYQIIKALNKLRAHFSVLKFDSQVVRARILDEIEQYNRILSLWLSQNNAISSDKATGTSRDYSDPAKKARKLLIVALEERLDKNLERIFRLLGLKYPPKDMFNAYLGIKSNKSNLRANSLEFLDNILEMNLKRILIPIVETSKAGIQSINTQKLFGFTIPTESECISLILQSDDNWLKVCTLYLIATLRYNKFIDSVVKLTDAPDPMVKETAKYCLERIRISN
jgi:AAA family ATP:ADP antiporter